MRSGEDSDPGQGTERPAVFTNVLSDDPYVQLYTIVHVARMYTYSNSSVQYPLHVRYSSSGGEHPNTIFGYQSILNRTSVDPQSSM